MVKKYYQSSVACQKGTAKAMAINQPISLKWATEICREIKGQRVDKAEKMLQRILEHKQHLPLRRYNKKVAHRPGEARSGVKSGRYPLKASKVFLNLLRDVKANADFKGMDAENLLIVHCFASQGFRRVSFQPKGKIAGKRRKKKSAHIEIVVREAK